MELKDEQSNTLSSVNFSGQTAEYFKIWIVNTALTIITLGIYSPWATVRKLRYFYTHTELAEGTFDFHANPKAILLGRVIALSMAGLYFGSGYIHPLAPFIVILFIFAIVPWLVVRSRIFRMRNTSYRGIRFNFVRDYKEAFKVYYLAGLFTLLSLGLATGSAIYMRTKFAIRHTGFGETRFTFEGKHRGFTSIFWRSFGLLVLVIVVYAGFAGLMIVVGPAFAPASAPVDGEPSFDAQLYGLIISVPLIIGYAAVAVYGAVRFRNYTWNTTRLGGNRFHSDLSVKQMLAIYLSNALAIVFSFGLMIPWAQIRLARYRAQHVQLELVDDWKDYVASGESEGSALGDEIGQAFDVELDLGF